MTDAIFIAGTAGSGKSTLTGAMRSWYAGKGEDVITVNLDPGVISLPYEPDVDVREKVDYGELMDKYRLGPNGAMILAADMVATFLGSLQEEIDSLQAEYVIIDTPGQTELFAFRESGQYIVRETKADSKVLLFLTDPVLARTPVNFLSLALLSTSVSLRLAVPRISVLTKRDIAKEDVKRIVEWSRDAVAFESALSKTRDGEEYSLFSELFRGLKRTSYGTDLYPVSSVTQEGIIAVVGEIARLGRGGEEITD